MQIFLNGSVNSFKEPPEILEPGFLFGWGTFEVLRVHERKIGFERSLAKAGENSEELKIRNASDGFTQVIKELLEKIV